MLFSPADFFNLFFSELDRLSIPYVVLHSYEDLPHKIVSDVDYAVMTRDLPRLAGIQRRLAESGGAVLAHTIEAHIDALYSVVIDPQNSTSFLQLDACGHYFECGRRLQTDTELLNGRRAFRSFFVPSPEVEFAYLLAKALAKGTDIAPRLPKLRELSGLNPAGAQTKFAQLTGNNSSLEMWLERPPEESDQLRNDMLRHNRPHLTDRVREMFRAARRMAHPKGFHIGLVGGDAESRGRLRERIGPILVNAFFRRQLNHDFALNLTSGIAHRPPCCAAMCIWQFTKEYFKTVFPAKVRNELVFSEGGIDEFLRKPTGYGIKSIGKRGGLIASRVPRPDLTILLPDTNAGFSQLLNRRVEFHPNRYLILNRNETGETQAAAIIQCAIRLLCNREQSLMPLI